MLTFQDEEILKGERRIREWQTKFVGLQSRLNDSMGNISEHFEDMLLKLDEMKIKVEELKSPGDYDFEKLKDEINEIDVKIGEDYVEIRKKLYS